ncbi:twin-arginine translocase TatA/TatE family subunit [Cellulomonas sp. S1-8]|uniref:twin-arginine translocase TatA/TatE family subunit n=1 Tax=Cellulomonas sp. S1-8 TaxID=2904790 RepID=UPI002244C701|nr:twin-arginine translocase TatA/TatE family subunit [Cellulomonas sp. S1-8]UZN05204.1 twin-arginine translocase TatA/TatE family subunit [Cellulomonas sp. S1-8]
MRPTATHVVILIIVVLLLFGANRLPGLARSVGQSLKIFKKEVSDLTGDDARNAETTGTGTPAPDPVTGAAPVTRTDVPPPPVSPPAPPRA